MKWPTNYVKNNSKDSDIDLNEIAFGNNRKSHQYSTFLTFDDDDSDAVPILSFNEGCFDDSWENSLDLSFDIPDLHSEKNKYCFDKNSKRRNQPFFDIDTEFNGDCFFDSISKMIPEKYTNAQAVRASVTKYCDADGLEWARTSLNMIASAGALSVMFQGSETHFQSEELDKYVSFMKKDGAWADDFWIAAVSKMENIKLEIYSPEGKLYAIYGENDRALDSILIYTGDHYYVRQFYELVEEL